MGVLDNNQMPINTVPVSVRAANKLKGMANQTFQGMVNAFNAGASIFWNNPNGATPQEIANTLGSDAKEIFELHAKLGSLIASIKPESIAEGSSVVGQFTINEDGTVTIIEPNQNNS